MYSIAMDVGKYRTYGIVERDGEITKEGYMPTTKEGFQSFLDGIDYATVIVEASSTIDRIVSMLPEHEIRVANPVKVRLSRIRLRSDNKSMEKHLYRGRVKGGGVFNLLPIPEVTIW